MKLAEASKDDAVLREEISFLDDFARENMKNYQVWYVKYPHNAGSTEN